MAHDTVKIELEASYPYSDFRGWFDSLEDFEKEVWVRLAKDSNRSENNTILLTKKAMELYCLEMDIDYIPNSEDYLETIYRRLISNLVIISLMEKDLAVLVEGELSFIKDAKFELTEKGKKYLKTIK
jgi:hypothetical protein